MTPWQKAEHRARQAMGVAERALALGDRGELMKAAGELRAALAVRPEEGEWAVVLGRVCEALEDWKGAVEAFGVAWAGSPGDGVLGLKLADAQERGGALEEALATVDRVIEGRPSGEAAYCRKVRILGRLGLHEAADEVYYLARTYTDRCARCDLAIGESLVMRAEGAGGGRAEAMKALALLTRLPRGGGGGTAEVAGRMGDVHCLLARAHVVLKQYSAARDHLLTAVRAASGMGSGHRGQERGRVGRMHLALGRVLELMKDGDGALAHLRTAVELDGGLGAAHVGLARLLLARKRPAAALSAARRARNCGGGMGVELLVARCQLALGQTAEALRSLMREVHGLPQEGEAVGAEMLLELGLIADRLRRPRVAIELLRRLTREYPTAAAGWQNLGMLLLRRRKFTEGLAASFEALRLCPFDAGVLHNLALAEARRGDLLAAMEYAAMGCERHPGDSGLRHLRLRLRWARVMGRSRWVV